MSDAVKPENVADTLRAARALIEDPKHWTKGALAKPKKRSSDDEGMTAQDPRAGAWCAVGAIKRVDGVFEDAALVALAQVLDWSGNAYLYGPAHARDEIVDFNDARIRRHKEVMRAFDKAIALAEKFS